MESTEEATVHSELVPLRHDYDEAVAAAERMGRPILVVLEAEWCAPCKQLEKLASQLLLRRSIVVKIDIHQETG